MRRCDEDCCWGSGRFLYSNTVQSAICSGGHSPAVYGEPGQFWARVLSLNAVGFGKARTQSGKLDGRSCNRELEACILRKGPGWNIPCVSATSVVGVGAGFEALLLARGCALMVRPAGRCAVRLPIRRVNVREHLRLSANGRRVLGVRRAEGAVCGQRGFCGCR